MEKSISSNIIALIVVIMGVFQLALIAAVVLYDKEETEDRKYEQTIYREYYDATEKILDMLPKAPIDSVLMYPEGDKYMDARYKIELYRDGS